MDIVEAVNIVLRLNGQTPVNRVDEADLNSRRALDAIHESRRQILSEGWSFNTELRDLQPNVDGRIPLSQDWFEARLPDGLVRRQDPDDGALYVWNVRAKDWHDKDISNVQIVFDISEDSDYDQLTEAVARYVATNGAHLFWTGKKSGQVHQLIEQENRTARMKALNTEPPASVNRTSGWNDRRALYSRRAHRRSG